MPDRILVYGNSGSGKTTLARSLASSLGVAHLDLDSIAWREPLVRHDLAVTLGLLDAFVASREGWVIEGCYGEIVAAATRACTELVFLNPGVETCVARCRERPWEPSKFETKAAQDAVLEGLIAWVRRYPDRDDEYGLAYHRAIYAGFTGRKREVCPA